MENMDITRMEIEGGEESEEAEIAAMEGGDDVEVGFSFKKLRRRIGKLPKKLKFAAAIVAPVPAFHLLAMARKKKGAHRKIAAIKKIAQTPPEDLPPEAAAMQPAAIDAWESLQSAAEVQEQAYEDTGDYSSYDPYAEGETSVEGDEFSLYEWGAMAGMHDVIGFSFKKAFRKLGRTIDPSKAGSPFRSALQAIPGVGPQLTAAADMLAKARAGDRAAKQKIADAKALAEAGDSRGKEALANLQAANVLSPKIKLFGLFSTYEYGARVAA